MFLIRHRACGAFKFTRARPVSTLPPTRTKSEFFKPLLLFSGLSVASLVCYYSILSRRADARIPLSPTRFTPATLIESEDTSPDTKLLTLSVPPELLPHDHSTLAPIWSVFVKDSDIQVERAYTPLEGINEKGHMKFWIKKYEHGEVGRWLHSRQVGDSIEIRGPIQTWCKSWQNGHWDEIIMVSGGTGITPFYQLLHTVFNARDTFFNTRFTLLHGCKSFKDLPPPYMMQYLTTLSEKMPDRFRLHLFAESTHGHIGSRSTNVQHGRIGKSALQNTLGLTHSMPWWRRLWGPSDATSSIASKRILVLICGPEGMVNAIAGPYGRNYTQGKVGGILGMLGLQSHQVWKL